MTSSITIPLDATLAKALDDVAKRTRRTREEIARDALRRQVWLLEFEQLRKIALPFAEARGYLTDEDVFRDV